MSRVLRMIDRSTGAEETTPAEGLAWAAACQRIARAEGGTGTVEETSAVARQLLRGEAIVTAGFHYEVQSHTTHHP